MPPRDGILAEILSSPNEAEPFLTRVRKFVTAHSPGSDNIIDDALGDHAWGEIRWDRSLGWPIAPRMADGFVVQLKHKEFIEDARVGQDGVATGTKGKWLDSASPLLWDGPHDEESFRVSFFFIAQRAAPQMLIVQTRTGIEWDAGNPWWVPPVRQILYPATVSGDGTFLLNLRGPTFIDPFTVVNEFYRK